MPNIAASRKQTTNISPKYRFCHSDGHKLLQALRSDSEPQPKIVASDCSPTLSIEAHPQSPSAFSPVSLLSPTQAAPSDDTLKSPIQDLSFSEPTSCDTPQQICTDNLEYPAYVRPHDVEPDSSLNKLERSLEGAFLMSSSTDSQRLSPNSSSMEAFVLAKSPSFNTHLLLDDKILDSPTMTFPSNSTTDLDIDEAHNIQEKHHKLPANLNHDESETSLRSPISEAISEPDMQTTSVRSTDRRNTCDTKRKVPSCYATATKRVRRNHNGSKQVKEKTRSHLIGESPKLHRMDAVKTMIHNAVEGLPFIPGCRIQAPEVCQIFCNRIQTAGFETVQILTQLFCGIGNIDSLVELKSACHVAQENEVNQHGPKTVRILKALEDCEVAIGKYVIRRRIRLVELLDLRWELEEHYRDENSYTRVRKTTKLQRRGRASTRALEHMEEDLCPEIDKRDTRYQTLHRRLQNHLSNARNWHSLYHSLYPLVLALIPTSGTCAVSTTKIERLPASIFTIFLELLKEERGSSLQRLHKCLPQEIYSMLKGETSSPCSASFLEEIDHTVEHISNRASPDNEPGIITRLN